MAISVHIKKKLKNFTLHVDLELQQGCLGLLGASGCGKSMTLKCIAGIETPDEGSIVIDGRVVFDSKRKKNLPPQKRRVGYLFQQYALFPHMTVRENVEAGLAGSRRKFSSKKEKQHYIEEILERFHIPELAEVLPNRLSGGQQQRVALARMIASEPEILLLDEPFSAMDSYLREQLLQEMKVLLREYQKDVIMVSHNRDEIYQMCPQMAVMGLGMIEISGRTSEIFQKPVTVGAARLTGCKNISRVKVCDVHEIDALDWGIHLRVADTVSEDITHVGMRAHDFVGLTSGDEGEIWQENVMQCALERKTEAPFEIYLILKNASAVKENQHSIWWKLSKKEWESMEKKVPDAVYFPPEKMFLLKEVL